MEPFVEALRDACAAGHVLTIAYAGGSNPGTPREVIPLSCSDTQLEARDVHAGIAKQYRLEKILWIEAGGVRVERAQPTPSRSLPSLQSLAEYSSHLRDELQSLGWCIHEGETSYAVGGYFKNGKPRRTPSISIAFFDRTTESKYDLATGEPVEVPRDLSGHERPWRVDSWRYKAARTFSSLPTAMWEFYNEVLASDPRDARGMFAGHSGH